MITSLEVTPARDPDEKERVMVSASSANRSENCITPSEAITVVVPPRFPSPVSIEALTSVSLSVVTKFPNVSRR